MFDSNDTLSAALILRIHPSVVFTYFVPLAETQQRNYGRKSSSLVEVKEGTHDLSRTMPGKAI